MPTPSLEDLITNLRAVSTTAVRCTHPTGVTLDLVMLDPAVLHQWADYLAALSAQRRAAPEPGAFKDYEVGCVVRALQQLAASEGFIERVVRALAAPERPQDRTALLAEVSKLGALISALNGGHGVFNWAQKAQASLDEIARLSASAPAPEAPRQEPSDAD